MPGSQTLQIELIPVDGVVILNPRVRNRRVFQEIVASIREVGLKRPITVTKNEEAENTSYQLVCGQGRLEAFRELGQTQIPAIVIEADIQTCLVKSLVENCARRKHKAIDMVRDIEGMRERGYSVNEISEKTGLSVDYIKGLSKLIRHGEQRLLRSVEAGQIPISVAVDIATADDQGIQDALQTAYENNVLRGRKLLVAKKIIERRRNCGKGRAKGETGKKTVSSEALVRAYQEDADRKKLLIQKADATRNRLLFIAHAVRELLLDEDVVQLLKAEDLDTVPKKLAARMDRQELIR